MLTFSNRQPDVMTVSPEWDSIRGDRFWNEIARETHQKRVQDIQPRITGLGKLSGVELGLVKVPQVAPGWLIAGGIGFGTISGLAAWSIYDSFSEQKGWMAAGLFAAGVVSGAVFLCSFVTLLKGVAVATGITKPEAVDATIQNPATGQEVTATIQNPNLPAATPPVAVTAPTNA